MSRRSSEERARGRKGQGSNQESNGWIGFADIPLSDEDAAEIALFVENPDDDPAEFLADVLQDGYKVTFASMNEGSTVVATLTGKAQANVNCGYSLSAFAPDLRAAIVVLWYKHVKLAQRGSWAAVGAANGRSRPLFG